MNTAVIGVGSNINPKRNIQKAIQIIKTELILTKVSSLHRTKPIEFKQQKYFYNCAFLTETTMDRNTLKQWLRNLEKNLGRVKSKNRNGPRAIDLDILVWNGEIVDEDVYTRSFLQKSVQELLPGLILD